MSSPWSINNAASDAVGASQLVRKLANQKADVCTFSVPGPFDADSLAYRSLVSIKKNGVGYFYGTITEINRNGEGADESLGYEVQGPWWWLENLYFQQTFTVATAIDEHGVPTFGNQPRPRVVLGQKSDGTLQKSGAQIREVLLWAIACGCPLQIGTIAEGVQHPLDQSENLTCAAAIIKELRWTPDCSTWFDYTTTPPTIHCTARGSGGSTTFTIGQLISKVALTPCHKLQVPAVVLYYEQGDDYRVITKDIAPVGASETTLGAQLAVLQLAGAQSSMQMEKLVTLSDTSNTVAWWKMRYPFLNDVIIDHSFSGEGDYAREVVEGDADTFGGLAPVGYELLEGRIQEWMATSRGIKWAKVKVTARFSYTTEAGEKIYKQSLSEIFTVCNTPSRQFVTSLSGNAPEDPPAGLAAALYASLNQLHYSGTLALVEQECSQPVHPGSVVNIAGSRSEWTAMNALVQEVTNDIDQGRTLITVGPPEHLSPQDLLGLSRVFRRRNPGVFGWERNTGKSSTTKGAIQGDGPGPKSAPTAAMPQMQKMIFSDGTKTVTIDPADTNDTVFNMVFVTDYGTESALLWSLPVKKKGDVLVITGDATGLEPYACP